MNLVCVESWTTFEQHQSHHQGERGHDECPHPDIRPSAPLPRRTRSALSGVSSTHVISRCLLWPITPYFGQRTAKPGGATSTER